MNKIVLVGKWFKVNHDLLSLIYLKRFRSKFGQEMKHLDLLQSLYELKRDTQGIFSPSKEPVANFIIEYWIDMCKYHRI